MPLTFDVLHSFFFPQVTFLIVQSPTAHMLHSARELFSPAQNCFFFCLFFFQLTRKCVLCGAKEENEWKSAARISDYCFITVATLQHDRTKRHNVKRSKHSETHFVSGGTASLLKGT